MAAQFDPPEKGKHEPKGEDGRASAGSPSSSGRRGVRAAAKRLPYGPGARLLSPVTAEPGRGTERTTGGGFPFQEAIQDSFGRHDISGAKARTGGSTATECGRLQAQAFVRGPEVAFSSEPDLETAAHEATHVVQQRAASRRTSGEPKREQGLEQVADEVARRVVQGQAAEPLLDRMVSAVSEVPTLQKKEKKAVGGKAAKRLGLAGDAIRHTKGVLSFGAGNQYEALKKSNFNSYFRLKVMRGSEYWEIEESVRPLAARYPDALVAAKAEVARGGNCGEHAMIAFDYLRVTAIGETISRADVEGLDHAFVLLGNLAADSDGDLAVSDPWPTRATACLWQDHFAYTPDRKKVNARNTVVGDGVRVKEVIARGLKLKPEGQRLLEMKLSEKETDEQIRKGTSGDHPWIWQQPGTTAPGRDFEYVGSPRTDVR